MAVIYFITKQLIFLGSASFFHIGKRSDRSTATPTLCFQPPGLAAGEPRCPWCHCGPCILSCRVQRPQPDPFSATHVYHGNRTPRNKRLDLRIELIVALDESVIETSNRFADNALSADAPARALPIQLTGFERPAIFSPIGFSFGAPLL